MQFQEHRNARSILRRPLIVALALLATFAVVIVVAGILASADEETAAPSRLRLEAVRPGTPGLTMPVLVSKTAPSWTPDAEQKGIFGNAYIEVVVNTEGYVVEPILARSVGDDELDRRALEAVTKWRFRPGLMNDAAIPVLLRLEVRFTWPED